MRQIIVLLSVPLLFSLHATAQQSTDFSGVWEMDRSRSASALQATPIGPVTLVIDQQSTDLRIETRRKEPGKRALLREVLTFKIDGPETPNVGNTGVEIKAKARWDGTRLVTETVRKVQGSTVTTTHVFSLDAAGKELTIDKTLTVQHGYQFPGANNTGTGRDIFVRRKGPSKK
jgi:hypothetical protein